MWRTDILSAKSLAASLLAAGLLLTVPAGSVLANALDDIRAGNELFKAGRLEEAVDAYSKAVTSGELETETLAITYNNRGVALGEQSEFDKAIEDYEKALQLLPDDPTTAKNLRVAFIKRGLAAQKAGDLDAANDDLNRAIEAEPSHYLGYLRRAELNVERGNLALAVSDYKLALARRPGDSELIAALGQAREALSRPLESQIESEAPAVETAEENAPLSSEPEQTVANGSAVEPEVEETASNDTGTDVEVRPARPAAVDVEPSAGGEFVRTLGAVNVRDAAANSGALVTTVAEGVVLPVLGEELGWKHVQLSDGRRGYIYRRWLEPAPGG